jgi:hypothetical protein
VKVRVHLSERIEEAKLAEFELATLGADNRVVAHAPNAPDLEDPYTALWTLTNTQWANLTAGAVNLGVAVTSAMRVKGWGETPVAPVPNWALRVYSGTSTTASRPVVKREPLNLIAEFIGGLAAGDTKTYRRCTT